jgi:hypothetical protein
MLGQHRLSRECSNQISIWTGSAYRLPDHYILSAGIFGHQCLNEACPLLCGTIRSPKKTYKRDFDAPILPYHLHSSDGSIAGAWLRDGVSVKGGDYRRAGSQGGATCQAFLQVSRFTTIG